VGAGLVGAGLGGASTHFFQPFKSSFLSKTLDQNMPKNAYFYGKKL